MGKSAPPGGRVRVEQPIFVGAGFND